MTRRVKVLSLSAIVLEQMLQGHPLEEVTTDFPASAAIVGCQWDSIRGNVKLVVEDLSFPEVQEGMIPLDMDIRVTSHITEVAAIYRVLRKEDTA